MKIKNVRVINICISKCLNRKFVAVVEVHCTAGENYRSMQSLIAPFVEKYKTV